MQALTHNHCLIDLNISSKTKEGKNRNKFTTAGFLALKDMLKENRFLQILNISGNNLRSQGVKILCDAYEESKMDGKSDINLLSLDLSFSEINCERSFRSVKSMLEKAQNLVKLNLSYNVLNDKGTEIISECFGSKKSNETYHYHGRPKYEEN